MLELEEELMSLEVNPKYEECKKKILESEMSFSKIELIQRDPDYEIFNYFQELKFQIELRREDLLDKINKYSDELILSVESTQDQYFKLFKQVDQISEKIEKLRAELDHLITQFRATELVQVNKFESLKFNAETLTQNCDEVLKKQREILLENKDYVFEYKEKKMRKVFGKFQVSRNTKLFSTILNKESIQDLNNLCGEFNICSLVFRATRDGFESKDFHRKCDNISNTLSLIKTSNGDLFGGFTQMKWTSNCEYIEDQKAIIFNLEKDKKEHFKLSSSKDVAIGCFSNFGPIFANKDNDNQDDDENFIYKDQWSIFDERLCMNGDDIKIVEIEVYTNKFISTILDNFMIQDLNKLCEIDLKKWSVIYRASRDGFRSKDFHSNCDGITNTLTVIKSKASENVFGGYTEKAWDSKFKWISDPEAFIFSLINEEDNPFKSMSIGQNSICCHCDYGPIFGGDENGFIKEIAIVSDSNRKNCYSHFGFEYIHQDYPNNCNRSESILAGWGIFQVDEIEVFVKTDGF